MHPEMKMKLVQGILKDLLKVPMSGGAKHAAPEMDGPEVEVEGLSNPDDADALKGDDVMPHGGMKHKFPRKGI